MKPLFTVLFATAAMIGYAAEAPIIIPAHCVWIEFSASDLTTDAHGSAGIFAKHRELGRVEDLRPSVTEPTIFDESTPPTVIRGGTRINGPRLPFARLERLFATGTVRRQVSVRSTPADLLIKRSSDGAVYGLWIDQKTRFPLRFVMLRPTS